MLFLRKLENTQSREVVRPDRSTANSQGEIVREVPLALLSTSSGSIVSPSKSGAAV